MEQEKLVELATKLQGISCSDWKNLKIIIDRAFDIKKSELERTLQLTSIDELIKFNRSLFG